MLRFEAAVAATGTWPSTVPAWLASPIDHVLAGEAWAVFDARVMEPSASGGTDHRPSTDRRGVPGTITQ